MNKLNSEIENRKSTFQDAAEMPYANSEIIKEKSKILFEKLAKYLKTVQKDKSLFFASGETVYIPDIHGDFVHLIITLYRHNLLDEKLNLQKDNKYVFLGDFYDRAPGSDVIDFWLNTQINKNIKIYRLIGNHEMAFFERDEKDHPVIFPSQDSIRDIENNFRITEDLLKNIAGGNILAVYVEDRGQKILYVHSYIINDDFKNLGLEPDTDITNFAIALNKRFQEHGEYAYEVFLDCKNKGGFNWELIMKSFYGDPLFDIYKQKNDINTSFLWRRTGMPTLNVYPVEIDVDIPNNVYQIVGHTPVFSFDLSTKQSIFEPFVVSVKNNTGKIQFSDVGIGYYYKADSFERPKVVINRKLAVAV